MTGPGPPAFTMRHPLAAVPPPAPSLKHGEFPAREGKVGNGTAVPLYQYDPHGDFSKFQSRGIADTPPGDGTQPLNFTSGEGYAIMPPTRQFSYQKKLSGVKLG